jgi:hypothetical protein
MDGNLGIHKWYTAPSGTAGDTISFTQALTLNTNGALVLQGGNTSASGVGVAFPATQVASSDANTLDDYEEGTWTPGIAFGGASVGVTYNTSFTGGTYTKIGNTMYVRGYLVLTNNGTSTGDATITGLPATSISGSKNYVSANVNFESEITFTGSYGSRIAPNNSQIDLYQYSTAGALTFLNETNFGNNAIIYIAAQYQV